MTTLMRREIEEIPDVVRRLRRDGEAEIAAAAAAVRAARPTWVMVVARGTSDHAAIYARYLIESVLGLPCALAAPSVTTVYEAPIAWRGGLVLGISQSGRSPDLVAVLAAARAGGALTVTIANDATSPLAAAAAHVVDCRAGPERSVAATKSYVAQLAAVAGLVAALAPESPLADGLAPLADVLEACLDASTAAIRDDAPIVAEFAASDRSLVVSRGYDLATALEVALKLKETGRLFAEGYSVADLRHGPIILSGVEIPLLAIRPDGRMGASVDEALAEVRSGGARPWTIAGRESAPTDPRAIALPTELPEPLLPLAHVLPGQLLAEAVARARGRDPDAPTGLDKVTLTR